MISIWEELRRFWAGKMLLLSLYNLARLSPVQHMGLFAEYGWEVEFIVLTVII
jgi:hypothetical protein